jgi:DNA-binding transcriptional LysR family regulator
LVPEPGCTSEMLVDRLGRDLLSGAQLAMVTGSISALLRLAGHGHGVSLLPELAVTRELQAGELVELRLAERIRPVSIVAQWGPRLGLAYRPMRALLEVARRADPMPEATRQGLGLLQLRQGAK